MPKMNFPVLAKMWGFITTAWLPLAIQNNYYINKTYQNKQIFVGKPRGFGNFLSPNKNYLGTEKDYM